MADEPAPASLKKHLEEFKQILPNSLVKEMKSQFTHAAKSGWHDITFFFDDSHPNYLWRGTLSTTVSEDRRDEVAKTLKTVFESEGYTTRPIMTTKVIGICICWV